MSISKKVISIILTIIMLVTTCSAAFPVLATDNSDDDFFDELFVPQEENSEAYIVSEAVEKREENAKHFRMSDGSYVVAQYNTPVHYLDENGEWVDIDNTISEAEATTEQTELFGTDELYSTANGAENVVFAEKSNSNTIVSYEAKDYPISFNYQSAKNSQINVIEKTETHSGDEAFLTLQDITQEVIYEDVFTDVDLQYIVSPTGLKENIILKSKSAQNSFAVNYNIGELTAMVVGSNTINLMSGDEVVYTISAPYMTDANGERSEAVTLTVEKNKNGKLCLVISADESWLSAEDRAYPVVVDPIITTTNYNELKAMYISSVENSPEDRNLSELHIKKTTSGEETQALIKLDSIGNSLYTDRIVTAELNLPLISSVTTNTNVFLYEIGSMWDVENVSWNSEIKISDTVVDYCTLTNTSTALRFDITDLYYKIVEDNLDCNGVLLKLDEPGAVDFRVKNNSSPVLILKYLSTVGLDEDYSYSQFDMNTAGTVYINNFTGNLIITRDEAATTGKVNPYYFTSTYNSFSTIEAMEPSWFRSYEFGFRNETQFVNENGTGENITLAEIADEPGSYSISDNSSDFEKIRPNYDAATGELISVDAWRDGDDTRYNFDLKKGLVGIFSDDSEVALFSREVIYNEDGTEVLYLVDGDGHKLEITETSEAYTVKQIDTDKNLLGDTVVYTKDASGNVTQITLNGNIQAVFTYDELNRMTSVTNDIGYKLTFGYDGESKIVTSVSESKNGTSGQHISFERTYNSTEIRSAGTDGVFGNDDDVLTNYRFNKNAQLTQVFNTTVSGEDLGAVAYAYNEEDNTADFGELTTVSAVGKNVVNLLENHNLESTDSWSVVKIADSSSSYTAVHTTEKSYSGLGSLKITTEDFTRSGSVTYTQTITPNMGVLEEGKSYAASVFVNADSLIKDADIDSSRGYGAGIIVRVTADKTDYIYSDSIIETSESVNNGWERTFATFTVPENYKKVEIMLVLRNAIGTAYFDSVQLEEGNTPNEYNILENNGFTRVNSASFPESWEGYNTTSDDVVENGRMKIIGDPDTRKGVYQDVYLANAEQSDSYTFSAWAEADAVPYTSGKFFIIYPFVEYEDAQGNTSWEHKSFYHFDYFDNEKQYVTGSFNLKHPEDSSLKPVAVRLLLCYYNQCNNAYFDNVALYPSETVYDLTTEKPITTTDGAGRITSCIYSDGTMCEYTYHGETKTIATEKIIEIVTGDDGEPTTETTIYAYNTSEQLVSLTEPDGTVYTYTYDNNGNLLSKLTADGIGDEYTYHGETDVIATEKITEVVTADDGTITTETIIYAYNTSKQLISLTEPDGTVYYYQYDDNGNLLSRLTADDVGDRYTYNDDGYITEELYEDGSSCTYTYHENGELSTETVTEEGITTIYTYDIFNNLLSVSKNNAVLESYTYAYFDTNNDDIDDKSAVATENLEDGTQNVYDYYSYNKLKTHTVTKNNTSITFHYDIEGQLTKVDHNGFSYVYEYGAFGNQTNVKVYAEKTDGDNVVIFEQSLISYDYQPDNSKVNSVTYGNGSQLNFAYDVYGNVVSKSGSIGNYTAKYDAFGKLIYKNDGMSGRKTYYKYDELGNLYGEKVADTSVGNSGNSFLYSSYNSLDENGNVTKNTLTIGERTLTTGYSYTESGLPLQTVIASSRKVNFAYDEDEILTSRTLTTNTPVVESFTYNDEGYISTHTVTHGEDNDVYSYTYDANGNITEIKKDGVVQQSYEYDALNQLLRENNLDTGKTIVYDYDGFGNIESKTEYAFTTDSLENKVSTDTVNYTYDEIWKDKLTSYDGQSITYDAIGNPMNYMGATMSWYARQMQSYSKGNTNITYKYDSNGLRTEKTVNGIKHEYYYVDGQLRYERNGGSYEIYYNYDADGRPTRAYKKDLVTGTNYSYYLITNTRGDVIETRDGDGNVNAKFVYDSWGKLISVTDGNGNELGTDSFAYQISLKYRGYVYDSETGLYYLQSRYYDPDIGRFINSDDVSFIGLTTSEISYNPFAYCENNPVNDADPTGHLSQNSLKQALEKAINTIKKWASTIWSKIKTEVKGFLQIIKYKKGELSISTTAAALAFDAVITACSKTTASAMSAFGFSLNIAKKFAKDKLENFFKKQMVPYITRGYVNTFLTSVRKILWTFVSKSTNVALEYATAYTTDKIYSRFDVYDIVSMFSSWGSFISVMLDVIDGEENKYITIRRA
ncbi:MAG: RHS repeat-associated core domain-containing protein [Clostridia bacterium]|nr:RHS repeat-associated core domain-containing protein [Clostridia bacterium]